MTFFDRGLIGPMTSIPHDCEWPWSDCGLE